MTIEEPKSNLSRCVSLFFSRQLVRKIREHLSKICLVYSLQSLYSKLMNHSIFIISLHNALLQICVVVNYAA